MLFGFEHLLYYGKGKMTKKEQNQVRFEQHYLSFSLYKFTEHATTGNPPGV